ncbi:Hypothetical protein, putative [Bodo saltans]|uniref:Uncharacterized protein n=1 Tax=Bodo saltans TaxID=75058 RepID=A0A0S4JEV0_BODSA|nr:Hypothetical protein, putative [Bodo saltans]|eukprot:CUG90097.1 Hypothetical protein, putative [Bodo saltans]
MLTVDDVVNSVAAMVKAGVFLSASALCGFGYLAGADTTVVAPSPSRSNVTLHCNVWSPLPLSTLVLVSSQRLPINAVTTVAAGGSIRSGKLDDWDSSCPFPHANISHTMTVSATNEVIVPSLLHHPLFGQPRRLSSALQSALDRWLEWAAMRVQSTASRLRCSSFVYRRYAPTQTTTRMEVPAAVAAALP